MTVPYTFASQTNSIPLSNLDSNFATPITLGNTAVYLGNTTTSLGNLTLTNANIASVSTTFPNSYLANTTTTLGNATLTLGGTTTTVGNVTISGSRLDPRVLSSTTATTLTPNIALYDQYAFTALASALTINAPTGTPVNGDKLIIRLKDNGISRNLTWTVTSGGYRVIGTSLPAATTANKTIYVGCIYNSDDVFWDVVGVNTQA
jgi:hypothetical protein